jgi:hypothetical protein
MATVTELTAPYENFLLAPRRGPDICEVCFTFTRGYARCYACAGAEQAIDLMAPISYSIAHEQLHHVLAAYKRDRGRVGRRLTVQLAAVLWRHLAAHERCLAAGAGVDLDRFELVTTVPSSDPNRDRDGDRDRHGHRDRDPDRESDETHPLRAIVGELAEPTRDRYQRLLRRTDRPVAPHARDPEKFAATRRLSGESILLIDDTWTTGANAQSAAAALKSAGAGPVAALVIGRHLKREWHGNGHRLRDISTPFDWSACALCRDSATAA